MLHIPAERVFLEYAEAVNRADRGWLEFLCAPDVSFAAPDSGVVSTGRRPVAEALLAHAAGHGDGAQFGVIDGEGGAAVAAPRAVLHRRTVASAPGWPSTIVVWEGIEGGTWRAVSAESLRVGPEGIAQVVVRGLDLPRQLLDDVRPAEPPAPIRRETVDPVIRTAPGHLAIAMHHRGTYFDFAIDPLFAQIAEWMEARRIPATGPWMGLFDDPTQHGEDGLPFTLAISVAGTLSRPPAGARSLPIVHPWHAANSWQSKPGELVLLAMEPAMVASVRRQPWRSTGEFRRLIVDTRRSLAAAGRSARWPIREYYHDTSPDAAEARTGEWELQVPLG